MAPSKWEDEEDSTPPSSPKVYAPRRKFDDEEDSDEVLDSWEAADDSDVEREKAAKAAEAKAKAEAEAAAQKKSKAQRIEEHKAMRRRQALEEEDESSDEEEEEEDAATQRARLKRSEKDSDLNHAQDLFGDIDLNQKRSTRKPAVISDSKDPTSAIDLESIPLFKPSTKTQFTNLTNTLVPLLTAQSKKPQYGLWVQEFTRQLVKELPSADIKKVASVLTTASNEKLKEEKAAEKGGKKSKAAKTKTTLVAARDTSRADLNSYDDNDGGLGDDDFM